MTLTFNVFGLEIARVKLDIERDETIAQAPASRAVTQGVKRISWAWVKGMMA